MAAPTASAYLDVSPDRPAREPLDRLSRDLRTSRVSFDSNKR
jgi:hypothetical protein